MRRARQPAATLLVGVALLALAGCGGGVKTATSQAGLKIEREDLIAVARALASTRQEVSGEVQTTKAVWRSVAHGLPANAETVPQPRIRAAATEAAAMKLPALFSERNARKLAGPASGVAGLFRGFARLSAQGWRLLGGALQQIEGGSPTIAAFARANSPLYIQTVYDAHFGLAQIGRRMQSAYAALGGPSAFGSSLTQAQVEQLAGAYSEESDRLHPHPTDQLGS